MSTDLTPGTDLAVIEPADVEAAADPAQYVVQACERAKTWLAHALEHGGIEEIVELKSQAEAIRIYTMQKQLGKDAELSAAEIVRRAERGLGLAVRRGQRRGEIARHGEGGGPKRDYSRVRDGQAETVRVDPNRDATKMSPGQFFAHAQERVDAYLMADNATDEQFDTAIEDGKAEGNLSRASVVRRVRSRREAQEARDNAMSAEDLDADVDEWIPAANDRGPKAFARRRELIRDLAGKAWTSRQIGERINITPDGVRKIARDEGIAVPADEVMGGTRQKIDSTRIVRETVNGLEGLEIALDLVSYDDLDRSEIEHWTTSLTTSIRILNRLNKRLKEIVQ